ncbi:hypothetical protein VN12_24320 [Pirellula sp. SH-Sr6A]|uniref:hypothetical protein n=1 Tax=Pirellula sp. SH-Sr6A TaxID=1632865 RepID=UPI00078CA76A|nr:hypothetical protein [Pirellula sp. SH-Sr6A]AMV35273.1 hypothetical protein VN12_24320 [Pirellula sp. SH-Sr6A]
MSETVSPADQITRVATLLGHAVLRWKRQQQLVEETSENLSDSLPERLDSRSVSSLSVTGPKPGATGPQQTSSTTANKPMNHARGAKREDRELDRRSHLATSQQAGRRDSGSSQVHVAATTTSEQQQGGNR